MCRAIFAIFLLYLVGTSLVEGWKCYSATSKNSQIPKNAQKVTYPAGTFCYKLYEYVKTVNKLTNKTTEQTSFTWDGMTLGYWDAKFTKCSDTLENSIAELSSGSVITNSYRRFCFCCGDSCNSATNMDKSCTSKPKFSQQCYSASSTNDPQLPTASSLQLDCTATQACYSDYRWGCSSLGSVGKCGTPISYSDGDKLYKDCSCCDGSLCNGQDMDQISADDDRCGGGDNDLTTQPTTTTVEPVPPHQTSTAPEQQTTLQAETTTAGAEETTSTEMTTAINKQTIITSPVEETTTVEYTITQQTSTPIETTAETTAAEKTTLPPPLETTITSLPTTLTTLEPTTPPIVDTTIILPTTTIPSLETTMETTIIVLTIEPTIEPSTQELTTLAQFTTPPVETTLAPTTQQSLEPSTTTQEPTTFAPMTTEMQPNTTPLEPNSTTFPPPVKTSAGTTIEPQTGAASTLEPLIISTGAAPTSTVEPGLTSAEPITGETGHPSTNNDTTEEPPPPTTTTNRDSSAHPHVYSLIINSILSFSLLLLITQLCTTIA